MTRRIAPPPAGAGRPSRGRAFTVVELLVVLTVIGILLGLLLPSLSGAFSRGKALREQSDLRQVGIAWQTYATDHRDQALPGYVHPTVQVEWRARYRFPSRRLVNPDDEQVDDGSELAAPWPIRLAPYLENVHEMLLGYADLDVPDDLAIGRDDVIDPGYGDDAGIFGTNIPRAETFALHPAFGYNAYYVGGWYGEVDPDERPRAQYEGLPGVVGDDTPNPDDRGPWVVKAVPNVRNASRLVLFTPTSAFAPPAQVAQATTDAFRPGIHYAVPSYMGLERVWSRSTVNPSLEVAEAAANAPDDPFSVVPIARYSEQVPALHADLSVRPWLPGELDDQRYWIDRATRPRKPTHVDP